MKRLAVCLALVGTFALIPSNAAQAAYCRCGPLATTPTITVTGGSNCSNATSNLETQLWSYVTCVLCREPVLTSTCSVLQGDDVVNIRATGYLSYRCYQLGGCQIP